MKIEHTFSTTDIADVHKLLNEFLKHISLVALSRREVDLADPNKGFPGTSNNKYSHIVKVINRWGIKERNRKYYELLNSVIDRIRSRHPTFFIYKPIELLLFNKMVEKLRNKKAEFTKKEIEIFFLQPHEMLVSSNISQSGISLYDLIIKSQALSARLKCKDSKEFLDQGVGRRLLMLKANVDSICKICQENRIEPLNDNENAILSLNTNAFYANIYAILDCLAFVVAFECPAYHIDRHIKRELQKVGLFNRDFYKQIGGLEKKLNLEKLKPWHEEITNLRHPIAHRIPLYFPEIYNSKDASKIRKAYEKYCKRLNSVYIKKTTAFTNRENARLERIRKDWQKAQTDINVFSGCFLHSEEESDKHYHLSRMSLDLGVLYYLLNKAFEYLCEI
jgi:hypothetical protein